MYRADKYDVEDLSAFWIRCASEMYDQRGGPVAPWVQEHYNPASIRSMLKMGAMVLVQREGSHVVAAVYIKPGSPYVVVAEAAHFGGLYVDSHLRNRGLGREMLPACLRWADHRRLAVSCSTSVGNERMLVMARLNRFEVTDVVPDKVLSDVQWNVCVRPAHLAPGSSAPPGGRGLRDV